MSISSPQTGGSRRPSTRPAAGAKKAGSGAAAKKATPAAGKPAAGKGGGGRPPITPVKVRQGRNWGSIGLSAIVALVAIGIVGFGIYEVLKSSETWKDQANAISGIVNYNKTEFNQAEYGPYPAKVSNNRVSDETVPVKILAPRNPVFNYPNRIGPAAWSGLRCRQAPMPTTSWCAPASRDMPLSYAHRKRSAPRLRSSSRSRRLSRP